jgi:hypothetical protein
LAWRRAGWLVKLEEPLVGLGHPAGTHIRWAADWDNTLLGRMAWRGLRTFYPEMMAGLVAAAERDAAQSP